MAKLNNDPAVLRNELKRLESQLPVTPKRKRAGVAAAIRHRRNRLVMLDIATPGKTSDVPQITMSDKTVKATAPNIEMAGDNALRVTTLTRPRAKLTIRDGRHFDGSGTLVRAEFEIPENVTREKLIELESILSQDGIVVFFDFL
jgi:hypothetical protein